MFTRRKLLLAGSVVALLAALVVGSAFAQTPTPQAGGGLTSYRDFFLDRLASILNVSRDQLTAAAKQAGQETVDKAVQDGKLPADKADRLRERIEQGDFFAPGFLGRYDGRGKLPAKGLWLGQKDVVIDAIAQALGMSHDELLAAVKAGKSVSDLAKEKGVSADAIKKAVVDAVGRQLDEAVTAGKLTAEQAAKIRQRLESMPAESFLQMGPQAPCRAPGGFRLPGMGRPRI